MSSVEARLREPRGGAALLGPLRQRRRARHHQWRCGRYRRSGLGGDGPADGDALGRARRLSDGELLEVSPGEEAGIKSATFRAAGENAYGLYSAEKGVHRLVRLSPFDSNSRRHTSFAGIEVAPVIEDDGRRGDRRRRPAGRRLPGERRRRPARQQNGFRGADHASTEGHRRPVPERALAVLEQGDRDDDVRATPRRAGGARPARRRSLARRARRRTSTTARRFAPTCSIPTRSSRTTGPGSRWRRAARPRRRPRRLRPRLPARDAWLRTPSFVELNGSCARAGRGTRGGGRDERGDGSAGGRARAR